MILNRSIFLVTQRWESGRGLSELHVYYGISRGQKFKGLKINTASRHQFLTLFLCLQYFEQRLRQTCGLKGVSVAALEKPRLPCPLLS